MIEKLYTVNFVYGKKVEWHKKKSFNAPARTPMTFFSWGFLTACEIYQLDINCDTFG